jgi:hypothetical protein
MYKIADKYCKMAFTQFTHGGGDFILIRVISSSSLYTAYTWRR